MQQTFHINQWTLVVDEVAQTYEIVNLGPKDEHQFYMVSPGPYGQPIVTPEPDLAFAVPTSLTYVNAKGETVMPTEKVSGIICQDSYRLSLTNAKKKGVVVRVNDDGSIQINNETWYLATLLSKDKQRFHNYDAYLVREMPKKVLVLELGDLNLFGSTSLL